MENIIDVFKALSDKTRLRMMHLLVKSHDEICSCEICDSLLEPQYSVSRNIKILKTAGLICERKEGKWVYYSLIKQTGDFQKALLKALGTLPDEDILLEDEVRFKKRVKLREDGKCQIGIQNKELMS